MNLLKHGLDPAAVRRMLTRFAGRMTSVIGDRAAAWSGDSADRPAGQRIVIAAVAGIIVLAAAWSLLRAAPDGAAIPDTAESETQWMCRACGHEYRLTARRAADEQARTGRLMPLYCESCGKPQAWRAATCAVHRLRYLVADAPGATGRCPRCYPPNDLTPDSAAAPAASAAPNGTGGSKKAASSRETQDRDGDAVHPPVRRRVPAI